MLIVEVLLAVTAIVAVFAVGSVLRSALLLRRRMRLAIAGRHPMLRLVTHTTRLVSGGSPRVAALRWRLARAVDAARTSLRYAVDADAPVGDLPHLLARLERLAAGHDTALAALGRGRPDSGQWRAAVERVRELTGMADDVRAGAVEALTAVAPDDPHALAGDITTEVTALREGRRAARA